jgi:pilus assembly protein Flp/PilA
MQRFSTFMLSIFDIKNDSGVTAIEYGLIASLIAVAIITAVTLVGTNLSSVFGSIATKL